MRREGLPIAAYLGIMLALALAAAFVAVFAILIWLPPRPPDVMRADMVADYFTSGYNHVTVHGRPISDGAMRWRIVRNEPELGEPEALEPTRARIARQLGMEEGQIFAVASKIVESERFVFEVRDIEDAAQEAERAAREAIREMELARAREAVREARQALAEIERERVEADAEHQRELEEHQAEQERELAMAERERARAERQMERERVRREVAVRRAEDARRRAAEARERMAQRGIPWTPPGAPEPPAPPEPIEPPEVSVEVLTPPRAPHAPPVTVRINPPPSVESVPPVRESGAARATPHVAPSAAPAARARSAAPAAAPAPPVPEVRIFAPAPEGVALISGFEIAAELPDGRWLVMRQGRNWDELGWLMRAGAIIGGALLVVTLLALLFARRLTRPIRQFSQAVQAVGVNPQSEPVGEEGPTELRGAARAVNTMQARLRALVADRTKTLAAVAHDMRTPLMRLRLAAENAPPEQRDRMAKEIGEVEALVASFIAFARDDPAEEARVRVDLGALLQSLADDHGEAGRNVVYAGEERAVITGQSLGLKRLFSNLIDNALKYAGNARITLSQGDAGVVVDVEDDGPGIPAEQRESVFEPFVRLNEEGTRGAGLGLAAARSIARAHGGDIVILDSENGARIRVTLPG